MPKKNGKIHLVHNLQPLNRVTIRDSAVPPYTEQIAESFGGRACYATLDLFVAFDQRRLDVRSRDLTTFSSPLGTFRLTAIPMGWTNSFQIMQGDVTFALKDEIPEYTIPYADDVPIRGPATRYIKEDGTYETIEGNEGIRRFVWEHMEVVHRILHRMGVVGGTFSGKKLVLCSETAVILGHLCNAEGRVPDTERVQRIRDWPLCKSVTEVRAFLGTLGWVRHFVRDFALVSRPLVETTRKGVVFRFGEAQERAMEELKETLANSPALRAIDYESDREVILAVDSSVIGVGYILLQVGEDGKRYPNRFGSIAWNEREKNYSQAKLELYGLMRALKAVRLYIVGVGNLTVEVDAKYIKGMLNNPDVQPNATINRWIATILLFHFKLVHVPAAKHTGADGLSRRPRAPEDEDEEEDVEDWIDRVNGFAMWELWRKEPEVGREVFAVEVDEGSVEEEVEEADSGGEAEREEEDSTEDGGRRVGVGDFEEVEEIPRTENAIQRDGRLMDIQKFLEEQVFPPEMEYREQRQLIRSARRFMARDGELWRKKGNGQHQKVPRNDRRLRLLRIAHDQMGHRGVFATLARLQDRFWWPKMEEDVKWFVRTCHECQLRQMRQFVTPPVVAKPATLFAAVYIDTMHMPKAKGFSYIVQARCSLTGYAEYQALRRETGVTIADFIRKNILFRWGIPRRIVTDNSGAYLMAGRELSEVGFEHVTISAYNSKANGIVERRHRDIREALVKTANAEGVTWVDVLPEVFWADRTTVQKSTGFSPFYLVHGVEPLLPFDISEVTYLTPEVSGLMETSELLVRRARALRGREARLEEARGRVWRSRLESVRQFLKTHGRSVKDFDFERGDLVLYRNTRVEKEASRKSKPRYLGPMVVVRRTKGGAYVLAELDGTVSFTRFAAFRIIPYFPRTNIVIPDIIDDRLPTISDDVEHRMMTPEIEADNSEEDSS